MSYYREQLESYLSELEIKVNSVLDIGGSANPVKSRVKEWDVKEYKIMDNGFEKESREEWVEPDLVWDLNEPPAVFPITKEWGKHTNAYFPEPHFEYKKYDLIFCLEVFEYIWNPTAAFSCIYKLLKGNGRAIMSFPFIYPIHNPKEIDYSRYPKNKILKLIDEANLKLVNLYPRYAKYQDLLKEFYIKEGMHPAKEVDHGIIGWIVEVSK